MSKATTRCTKNTNGRVSDGYVPRRCLLVDLRVSAGMFSVNTLIGLPPYTVRSLIGNVKECFIVVSVTEDFYVVKKITYFVSVTELNISASF